ncbi:MAG TPA: chromate transporter [Thermomicrobiales bacterium]
MIDPFHYFLIFLKASLFSTGGLSNLPSLHQDLLAAGWAEDAEFGRSIVIGQLSPGPNGLWVISLGYLTYGFAGAILALIAITIPAFLVLFVAAGYARIARARWVGGAMRGVALAVVGILLSVVWTIMRQPGVDRWGVLIAVIAFGLAATKRVRLPLILALAGCAGLFLYR